MEIDSDNLGNIVFMYFSGGIFCINIKINNEHKDNMSGNAIFSSNSLFSEQSIFSVHLLKIYTNFQLMNQVLQAN